MRITVLMGLLFSFQAMAATQNISVQQNDLSITKARGSFSTIRINGLENSRTIGAPELPVKSFLVVGQPKDIQVDVKVTSTQRLQGVLPAPAQAQLCRCENDRNVKFAYNARAYDRSEKAYKVSYLGAFRGTPVSRVDVPMASYNARAKTVTVYNEVAIEHSAPVYSFDSQETYTDYLIIAPEGLTKGTETFVNWKRSQGYSVIVEGLKKEDLTLTKVADIIKGHYTKSGTDFVIIIGDDRTVPMHNVSTSGSSSTPSDLKYFTMDDAKDYIPDMFYGRVVAANDKQVAERLDKAVEFDKQAFKNMSGIKHVVGIASNEGSSPSDNDYVKSIEDKLVATYGFTTTHFYQNDSKSNPKEVNARLSEGASWLFYMGHGSGTSWPSLSKSYDTSHIKNILNLDAVKPTIIDVACMNGRITSGYLGSTFAGVENENALGSAAYYGGTVNISWHPPAIMARGIAFEHAAKNFRHLGEALLAGQMYLAANLSSSSEVIDNFEWYHLQGDPGMLIGQ